LRFFEFKEMLCFISRAIFSRRSEKPSDGAAQRAGRRWRHVRAPGRGALPSSIRHLKSVVYESIKTQQALAPP